MQGGSVRNHSETEVVPLTHCRVSLPLQVNVAGSLALTTLIAGCMANGLKVRNSQGNLRYLHLLIFLLASHSTLTRAHISAHTLS